MSLMVKWSPYIFLFLTSTLTAQVNVLMQHNDLNRSGWNSRETKLTTGNVKTGKFGYLFNRSVDDQIYAQPLVMNVTIPNVGKRNVVYVATVNNSVYAFEADSINVMQPYWNVNLNPAGGRAVTNSDYGTSYQDFSGKIGIVGTPVIDSVTSTIYLVAKSNSPTGGFQQFLHALDVTTGKERSNSPQMITASMPGSGYDASSGTISFNAYSENQRSALLLLNGIVYIAWASHGDADPYHGWILGYDKVTLAQKVVYNSTPAGYKGGIWMAGAGMAADGSGNIYVAVGNGSVGTTTNPADLSNRSESALKLTPSGSTLTVSSFFTPKDWPALEEADLDFGVTGFLLIPGTRQAVAGAKDGNIYLMNRDTMGGYNASTNQVVQQFYQNSNVAHNLTSLTYFHGIKNDFVYTWSDNVTLKALPYSTALKQFDLLNVVQSPIQGPVGYNGAFLSVSSNGGIDSTAILWASHAASGNANQSTRPGILRALMASDISKELWNTSMSSIDDPGNYAKFNCPTIANGKVYLATFSNRLMVYGLQNGVVTGVKEKPSTAHIYPNPAKDFFNVSSPDSQSVGLKIVDLNGRVVYEADAVYNDSVVGVGNLPNGMYLVQIRTPIAIYIEKLIVKK
jgi:hypothetical protein